MKFIFLLPGNFIDLAKEEALSLLESDDYKLLDRLLIVELKSNDNSVSKRLALTKNIYRFLFECRIDDIEKTMKGFDWNLVYKDSFCLRVHNLNNNCNKKISNKKNRATSKSIGERSKPLVLPSEKELAKYVWRSVKYSMNKFHGELKNQKFLSKPKVNLENPRTRIELFLYGNRAYCGLLLFENKEDFESRKSHLRPFPSPSSLHPRLARALVNLAGIKENEVLIDPFCGAGGFLIEAGLINIEVVGYDINKIMTSGCKRNLDYFKIKGKLKTKNALDIDDKFDCLVTDLPYGLNSNAVSEYHKGNWKLGRINKKVQKEGFTKDLEGFYLQFLKNLRKKIKKKAVIVFPSYVNYRSLLKKARFKMEKEFSNYVHGSLTRKIVKVS